MRDLNDCELADEYGPDRFMPREVDGEHEPHPADAFNLANPAGSPVIAWPLTHDDPPLITVTRSVAWTLGDGTAVVAVEGYTGGIALTHVVSLRQHDAEVATKALEPVLTFINQRPEYVTALKNNPDADSDYYRWQGGAEARRQLATKLGLTVPHEPGDRAEPKP